MESRMLNDDLLKQILEEYLQAMEKTQDISEAEYLQGKQLLGEWCTAGQITGLEKIEALYLENCAYVLRAAFRRGTYVGFSQYLTGKPQKDVFSHYVMEDLIFPQQPRQHYWYDEKNKEIDAVWEEIFGPAGRDAFEEDGQDALGNVADCVCALQATWSERICGVARCGFYLGYRYALCVIDDVDQRGGSWRIRDQIFRLEHEIGFSYTKQERENYQNRKEEREKQNWKRQIEAMRIRREHKAGAPFLHTQRISILIRLVVPLRPTGMPAVITARLPSLT